MEPVRFQGVVLYHQTDVGSCERCHRDVAFNLDAYKQTQQRNPGRPIQLTCQEWPHCEPALAHSGGQKG